MVISITMISECSFAALFLAIIDYLLTGLAQNLQVCKAYICSDSHEGRKIRNCLNTNITILSLSTQLAMVDYWF